LESLLAAVVAESAPRSIDGVSEIAEHAAEFKPARGEGVRADHS
jgi:hypothetical protein